MVDDEVEANVACLYRQGFEGLIGCCGGLTSLSKEKDR